MRIILRVVGALFIVVGGIWSLQGLNILGGSPMSGESEWTRNGVILAVVGVALLVLGLRRRR